MSLASGTGETDPPDPRRVQVSNPRRLRRAEASRPLRPERPGPRALGVGTRAAGTPKPTGAPTAPRTAAGYTLVRQGDHRVHLPQGQPRSTSPPSRRLPPACHPPPPHPRADRAQPVWPKQLMSIPQFTDLPETLVEPFLFYRFKPKKGRPCLHYKYSHFLSS